MNCRTVVIFPFISRFSFPGIRRLKSLLPLILCFAFRAFAQFSAATVTGVVQDAGKAGITDASIKLINTQTGTENESATNHEGGFLLPGIIPGVYTLQIESSGFATTQVNGITLNAGDTRNLLIRMKVGGVTETVSVDASGLTLNRIDASVSTIVDRDLISTTPLSGRSLRDLFLAVPGIVTQSPQAATQTNSQTQSDFSVNGQQPAANSFFVDGVSANGGPGFTPGGSRFARTGSVGGSTALGGTQSLISVDALQEFRVLTSTYSAEYGRMPGGQFNFVTRSGGSAFHGSVYDYERGNYFDARDWFSGTRGPGDPPRYSQNDFGATLGGPIVWPHFYNGRDKSVFFLSYEGLAADQPTPQVYPFGPSICYYTGCHSPAGLALVFDTFPIGFPILDAQGTPYGLGFATVSSDSFPAHFNSTSLRVDQALSPGFSLFLRYQNTPSKSQANQLYSATTQDDDTQTLTLGVTNQFAAVRSNELRLGYATDNSQTRTQTVMSVGGSDQFVEPTLNAALGIPDTDPSAEADAYLHITGVGDSDSNTHRLDSSFNQWNLRDTFNFRAHNHLLKLGIDERRISSQIVPAALSVLADYFTYDSMLTNTASDLVITRSSPANPVLNEFSAFAQDEWKISHTLTLSAGLRWDVNPAPKGKRGQDAYTLLGDVNAPETLRLAPRGTPLWRTSWPNFAPRIGAAWVARDQPGKELIIRAGGGVFFDTGTQPGLEAFGGIGFSTSAHFLDATIPASPSQINFSTTVTSPYTNEQVFAFSPHQQLPYTWQWNLGIEQALGRNQSLTVSYVGAGGRRLLQEQRRNVNSVNPDFADVSYFPHGITSSFESLQTKFQRSLSASVEALVTYTWAHSLDYGSTDPFYPLQKGNSDLDVRQNLEAAATWTSLPQTHPYLSFKRLAEGWGADVRLIARTGFPINPLGNFFFDPITGRPYYSGVDLTPGRALYLHGSEYPGRRMINGGQNAINPAFTLPTGIAQGDAPRNLARGFDAVQPNVALKQTFRLPKGISVQLKGESFNVVNHPVFGYIDPSLSDLLFGQANKTLGQSFGAAGALYNQGGPRAIQLSLRATF